MSLTWRPAQLHSTDEQSAGTSTDAELARLVRSLQCCLAHARAAKAEADAAVVQAPAGTGSGGWTPAAADQEPPRLTVRSVRALRGCQRQAIKGAAMAACSILSPPHWHRRRHWQWQACRQGYCPWHEEPEPAVQPKQWLPQAMRRPVRSERLSMLNTVGAPAAGRASCWLKSQSYLHPTLPASVPPVKL